MIFTPPNFTCKIFRLFYYILYFSLGLSTFFLENANGSESLQQGGWLAGRQAAVETEQCSRQGHNERHRGQRSSCWEETLRRRIRVGRNLTPWKPVSLVLLQVTAQPPSRIQKSNYLRTLDFDFLKRQIWRLSKFGASP